MSEALHLDTDGASSLFEVDLSAMPLRAFLQTKQLELAFVSVAMTRISAGSVLTSRWTISRN
jgi:hypothetical protein